MQELEHRRRPHRVGRGDFVDMAVCDGLLWVRPMYADHRPGFVRLPRVLWPLSSDQPLLGEPSWGY